MTCGVIASPTVAKYVSPAARIPPHTHLMALSPAAASPVPATTKGQRCQQRSLRPSPTSQYLPRRIFRAAAAVAAPASNKQRDRRWHTNHAQCHQEALLSPAATPPAAAEDVP